MSWFSATITPTSSPKLVLSGLVGIRRVNQISFAVRSLGDASYVAIGGSNSQDRRMIAVGESIAIDTPASMRFVPVDTLFIISDGTTPIVELFGDSYEGR